MGNLSTLLRLVAHGASLHDAWKEAGFPSLKQARGALENLAGAIGTDGHAASSTGGDVAAEPGDASSRVDTVIVYTDGASRGNPGPASVAAVAYLPPGELLTSLSRRIGTATNNVAEYRAVLVGLELARSLRAENVEVRLDSELVVKQLNGEYRVRKPDLRPLHQVVLAEARHFAHCTFEHITRDQNTEADRLANKALDSAAADQ